MTRIYAFLALVVIILVTILGSFIGGIFWEKNATATRTTKVDSLIILDKIENEAYVITKTVFINQESKITVDQGSDWSNFWWGQTITAQGLMKINVGVDFSKLKSEDIVVDNDNKVITIKMGNAKVLSTSIDGPIKVESVNGLLKQIFDNNTNKDYNTALAQLTQDSTKAVENNTQVMEDARTDSAKLLRLVVRDTGYDVKFE